MQALFYLDLATKKASEALGGAAFRFASLVYGEDIDLKIRLAQRINGKSREVSRTIRELRCSIGRVDARPEGGKFRIKVGTGADSIGDNITTEIPHNATAKQVQDELNALSEIGTTFGTASVELKGGSWLVQFAGETSAVDIEAHSNSLFPISFLRVRASEFNGEYVHDLRLIQSPVADTDQSARVVPPPPAITTLIDGGTDNTTVWPEVQKLFVPPTFRGVYQIRRGFKKTRMLDRNDGHVEIAEQLNAHLADDGEIFTAELPTDNTIHITFAGNMIGYDQDPLEIEVFDAPEGDLSFTLSLDTPELHALLRKSEKVTLPIEIEADVEDENDSSVVHTFKLLRDTVEIERSLRWEELSVAASIDWLRPPLPKNYVPFSTSQVSNGQLHYSASVGDNTTTDFVIDHNLDTDTLDVIVHDNASSGSPLVYGTDYTYARTNSNSLTVTFTSAPATNSKLITVLGLEQTSYFDSHTHPIAQITNLQTILDDFGVRITSLETLSPSDLRLIVDESSYSDEWLLPNFGTIIPTASSFGGEVRLADNSRMIEFDDSTLPRSEGQLLPAIHSTSPLALPITTEDGIQFATQPSASNAGQVFQNQTSDDVFLSGFRGHKSAVLKPNEFAGCDGEFFWSAVQYGSATETTYYPLPMERTLFTDIVTKEQLVSGRYVEAKFAFELGVLKALTAYHYHLVLEVGTFPSEATPATTGSNLENVIWNNDAVFDQRLAVTSTPRTYEFGYRVGREDNTLSADAYLFGSWITATEPDDLDFAIRARLIRGDTENSTLDSRGFVWLSGPRFEFEDAQKTQSMGKICVYT